MDLVSFPRRNLLRGRRGDKLPLLLILQGSLGIIRLLSRPLGRGLPEIQPHDQV